MAIDISHRRGSHINKVTISKKPQKGLSFLQLTAAALIMAAAGLSVNFFNTGKLLLFILSVIGFGSVPIFSFLTSMVYNTSKNPRKTLLILAGLALICHIPYVILITGKLKLFNQTSVIFACFMGYMALVLQDMQGIDRTVKAVTILLICFACAVADGGSVTAVWILIFGSRYDTVTKKKLFYTAGIILIVINLIYGIIGGCWYAGLYQLGFLIPVPFIRNYNQNKGNSSGNYFFTVFYLIILLLSAILKCVFL